MRRIVITGMGALSPLAAGVEATWSRLLAGQSGIRRLPEDIVADLGCKIGGTVPSLADDPAAGFDPDRTVPPKDQRKMDRFILFALAAAAEALEQAGWKPVTQGEQQRTATVIATGVGGFPAISEAVRTADQRGVRRLSPFTIPSFVANLAAGQVSIRHGFKGPIGTPVTACAAGVQAIGDAARLIRADEADIAICGGTEACINTVSMGGFAAARSVSTGFNETPQRASRPFDADRDGFVMGEGAGILVIEALDHALARGANRSRSSSAMARRPMPITSRPARRTDRERGAPWNSPSRRRASRRGTSVTSMPMPLPRPWATGVKSRPSSRCSGATAGSP